MVKVCLKYTLSVFLMIGMVTSATYAQTDNSPLTDGYVNDVQRYSLQYPSYDPVSIVMPGASNATGFGAYQENPASMGLFKEGFMSFGLSSRYVNEDATYLGNTTGFDDNQTGISDIGFVYKVPTSQGKLVIGGGYSQAHDYNRAISGSGRNNMSTITDYYANLSIDNPINEAAFNAFAIDDYEDANGNIRSQSIFRFLPQGQEYPGISQRFEETEEGQLGEYSAFIATEFFKDFIVGASIGVVNGSYTYSRDFVEIDSQGDYDGEFIETDEGDTDIDNILSENYLDVTFSGFSARLGAIYQISPHFNIGGSYQFKNTLQIDEKSDFYVTTTMDNGLMYEGEDLSEFEYEITRPSRLNAGVTAKDLSGLTISASVEWVDYSESRIEFDDLVLGNLDIGQLQADINNEVRSNLDEVYNYRFGLEYDITDRFTPRIGYGYYPSPNRNVNADRQFYSAGFSAKLGEASTLNFGAQLGQWDDEKTLYSTSDFPEVVYEEVYHWNIMAGITIGF